MHCIVCIDDRMGISFGGRRQSRDRVLCEDIVKTVREQGGALCISPYSVPLFDGMAADALCVSETYLADTGEDDFCFCEREALAPWLAHVQTLIVYRWNRHYPSDQKLDVDLSRFVLQSRCDFAGSSHDNITKEVYVK